MFIAYARIFQCNARFPARTLSVSCPRSQTFSSQLRIPSDLAHVKVLIASGLAPPRRCALPGWRHSARRLVFLSRRHDVRVQHLMRRVIERREVQFDCSRCGRVRESFVVVTRGEHPTKDVNNFGKLTEVQPISFTSTGSPTFQVQLHFCDFVTVTTVSFKDNSTLFLFILHIHNGRRSGSSVTGPALCSTGFESLWRRCLLRCYHPAAEV